MSFNRPKTINSTFIKTFHGHGDKLLLMGIDAEQISPVQPSRYRVGFIPHAAYSLALGGMEVQQEATINALKSIGVDVVRFDVWSHTLDVDVVHVFGSEYPHTEIIERLRAKNIPLVVTAMFMPERPLALFQMLKTFSPLLPGTTYSLRKRSLNNAQSVIALTEQERVNITKAFGVPPKKIRVVANGVDDRFFTATSDLFTSTTGLRDVVLCVGSIDPRKNQLFVAETLKSLGYPIVFIGPVATHGGAETVAYAERFERVIDSASNLHWIKGIDHNDPLLASAYAAARVHVLVSTAEAQGLVTLEAAATGAQIVVSDLPHLRSMFGDVAFYAQPTDASSITRSVKGAWERSLQTSRATPKVLWLQSWHDVAVQLNDVYTGLLSPR